jgi:hypothetical protein
VAETYENGGFCAPERKGALTQCLWNIAPPLLPEGGAFTLEPGPEALPCLVSWQGLSFSGQPTR